MAEDYKYDVFISYSHKDAEWVERTLLPRLEAERISYSIDFKHFAVGRPTITNIEELVEKSRHILLVLTPNWLQSEWTLHESLLVRADDPSGLRGRTIPLLLAHCKLPKHISILHYSDFTKADRIDIAWNSLLTSLRASKTGSVAQNATTAPFGLPDFDFARFLKSPSPARSLAAPSHASWNWYKIKEAIYEFLVDEWPASRHAIFVVSMVALLAAAIISNPLNPEEPAYAYSYLGNRRTPCNVKIKRTSWRRWTEEVGAAKDCHTPCKNLVEVERSHDHIMLIDAGDSACVIRLPLNTGLAQRSADHGLHWTTMQVRKLP